MNTKQKRRFRQYLKSTPERIAIAEEFNELAPMIIGSFNEKNAPKDKQIPKATGKKVSKKDLKKYRDFFADKDVFIPDYLKQDEIPDDPEFQGFNPDVIIIDDVSERMSTPEKTKELYDEVIKKRLKK